MHISVYFWAARAAALGLLLPPRAYCPFSCGYFERRDSCCVDFSGGHDCCVASWSSLPLVLSNIIHYSKQTRYYYMPGPVSVVVAAAAAFRTLWLPEILFVSSRELLGFIKFGLWDLVGWSVGAGPRTAAALIILFGIRTVGVAPRGASRRTYKLSWKISSARVRLCAAAG